MQYGDVVAGVFLSRSNRFVAEVEVAGQREIVHVKNTGRCRELLVSGATVYLERSGNPLRRTAYDLIAVEKKRPGKPALLVNMDSQAPNAVAHEWLVGGALFGEGAQVRREVTFGKSRFDLYVESGGRRCFIEVKGVTLEHEGIASFPDAPTQRGVKHIHELADAVRLGYEAYILFVLQMKEMREFRPADELHAEFGEALRAAAAAGVKVLAMDCRVSPNTLSIDQPVQVVL